MLGITARHMGWLSRDGRSRTPERSAPLAPAADDAKTSAPAPSASPPPAAPEPAPSRPAATPPSPPKSPDTRGAPAAPGRDKTSREAAPKTDAGKDVSAAVASGQRFAVEFGPFVTNAEAEKTERQLNEAGHQTVRFRQQTGAALYAVLIDRLPGAREAQTVVATLREQGFTEAVGVASSDGLAVRVGEPMLLRGAVQLAESLKANGHQVRVASQPGEAQTLVIRHGNFASREEAEAKGAELGRLNLPNRVVRAK